MDELREYIESVIGCISTLSEVVNDNEEDDTSETYMVANHDSETSIDFMRDLENVIRIACVLATYAGADETTRNDDSYGFGADSKEYVSKYIKGGMELLSKIGSEDFYETVNNYFDRNIKP